MSGPRSTLGVWWAALLAGAVCVAASGARADRAAVEFTMSRMEAAVLAGDGAAYLMNIVTDDAIFLQEQRNWAKDLDAHTPTAFELEIHEPRPADEPGPGGMGPVRPAEAAQPPEFDEDEGEARFEIVMNWTLPRAGGAGEGRRRTVSYPALFRRQEDGRWLFAGEDWRQAESDAAGVVGDRVRPVSAAPNSVLYFDGFEDVARRAVNLLPEVRAHVDAMFGRNIAHPQVIKIYPTMQHLQSSIFLSYTDGLAGWNEPGESIKLLVSDKTGDGSLRVLLAHEYGHVATFELGPHASSMPWWALEGAADQSAEKFAAENSGDGDRPEEYGSDARRAVQRWARRDRLAPWDKIAVFRDTPREYGGHVYKQGQHMLGFITRQFGLQARNAWLMHMAMNNGPTRLDDATREALGLDGGFAALDRQWRATLPQPEPEETDPEK